MSEDTADQLGDVTAAILGSTDPRALLTAELGRLVTANRPDLAVQLFESMLWRVDVIDYWTLHIAAGAYHLMGQVSMAVVMYGLSHRLHPEYSGAYAACRNLFEHFVKQGRDHDALAVFEAYGASHPHSQIAPAYRVTAMLAKVDPNHQLLQDGSGQASDDRETMVAFEATFPQPLKPKVFGPFPLVSIDTTRPPGQHQVNVTRLRNALVQIQSDTVLVRDRNGVVQSDLSLHDFPTMFGRYLDTHPIAVEPVYLPSAVLVCDRFSGSPNPSHFLLDAITRLAIYQKCGVDTAKTAVIGGKLRHEYQTSLLQMADVTKYIGTDEEAVYRVGELWVSDSCREVQHPLHNGSPWALDFMAKVLRPVISEAKPTRRLYVSRKDAQSRHITNEPEMLELLRRYGFEEIVPGSLPIRVQLATFSEASHVVGAHGAGLTNVAACRPGTAVLEVFHPLYGTWAYAVTALGKGLNYAAMMGRDGQSDAAQFNEAGSVDLSNNLWGLRDIRVDIPALEAWLAEVF